MVVLGAGLSGIFLAHSLQSEGCRSLGFLQYYSGLRPPLLPQLTLLLLLLLLLLVLLVVGVIGRRKEDELHNHQQQR